MDLPHSDKCFVKAYDAIKHLLLCRIERRPPRLILDVYPYLPRARVATTAAATYMSPPGGPGS